MTETKPGDSDPVVEYFGEARVAELDAACERITTKMALRRAAMNERGHDLPFLSADLSHEQVVTGLVDRTGWALGPWDGEPDQVMWAAREPPHYRCMAWRMGDHLGHLNGYVAVPKGHRVWGLNYDADELSTIDVHGGLTFCARGVDDSWVFGFDCAHWRDVQPGTEALLRKLQPGHLSDRSLVMPGDFGPSYKTIDFVRAECESLALQLAQLAALPPAALPALPP